MSFGFGFGFPKNYVAALFNTPASLFTTGVNGAWYDPSDFSTMFQDAAGTTPVTAVGQPVGLMLDKSKGLVLGPELVTNGDFSNGTTGWTLGKASWSITGGKASNDGTNGVYASLVQNGVINSGKFYVVEWDQTITSGSINLWFAGTQSVAPVVAGSGRKSYKVRATVTGSLFFEASIGGVLSIDNISVRELPGNHAFNPSGNSANFPVLSARYNLLTKTEQFDDAVWGSVGISPFGSGSISNATYAPNGVLTADLIVPSTSSSVKYIDQSVTTTASTTNTWSIYLKAAGYSSAVIYFISASTPFEFCSATVDLSTGQISNAGGFNGASYATASATNSGNGWWKVSLTGSIGVKTNFVARVYVNSVNSYAGDGTSGIYIWGADLRVANDALNQPSYQRVNTSSDYDTVGFKPYLSFNGVNQWLQTNSIDFTYGDKMFVSAGVRKLSDAAFPVLLETATSAATTGSFHLYANGATSTDGFAWGITGTAHVWRAAPYTAAPRTIVKTAIGDLSLSNDAAVPQRENSVSQALQAGSGTATGGGNYGNYPLYIGSRAGSSLWFNGRLYGLVVAGKQASASEITSTETYLNNKTGAY